VLRIRSKTQVSARVIANASHVAAIGAFCIGTNQIDLPTATRAGVAAFNAPFSSTRSVVELAIAETIALNRRLVDKSVLLQRGVWDKSAANSHEVRGQRLGIVGYGNIGSQLSVVAEALGMSVCFYDVEDKLALGNAQSCASLNELLDQADIVSLHVDGRSGNAGLFGEAQLRRMKEGAIFLNLSRGFVVDHDALHRHLADGHLSGAAVDVFLDEPKTQGPGFTSALQSLPNVILTPHIGAATEEAQEDIGRFVATKLRDHVLTGSTQRSVNVPPLGLRPATDVLRFGHLHYNISGVLARVNGLLAERGVNVSTQALATAGDIGYLVTDATGADFHELAGELARLPETIRVRRIS
jgi:D-3-phosphoglycerate dehydrogenase